MTCFADHLSDLKSDRSRETGLTMWQIAKKPVQAGGRLFANRVLSSNDTTEAFTAFGVLYRTKRDGWWRRGS